MGRISVNGYEPEQLGQSSTSGSPARRWAPPTPEQRFWAKVDILSDDECWEWLAGTKGRGYGQFHFERRTVMAHRMAYELTVGPIPEGLVLDHLCRNPPCVNPAHLEPVTQSENVRRGSAGEVQRARRLAQVNCRHGHPLSGDNVYRIPGSGYRSCKTCRAKALAEYNARRKAATRGQD